MVISNVGFYPCRTKLCVRQILPVTHPRFSPTLQHVTDVRNVIYLPKKGSVAWCVPLFVPLYKALLQFKANLSWVLLQFNKEPNHLCLMLQTYTSVVKKPTLCPPPMPRIVGLSHKNFLWDTPTIRTWVGRVIYAFLQRRGYVRNIRQR